MILVSTLIYPLGTLKPEEPELSDLSSEYLLKHHPVSSDEFKLLDKRKKKLISAGEQIKNEMENNPYSLMSIKMRSRSDLIVAKILLDALNESRRTNYSKSLELIDEAKKLAPEYFEVHRCDGWVKACAGNITAARKAYEIAIDLEPKYGPLRFWFGGFLLRNYDAIEAFEQYELVNKIDPNINQVLLEFARASMYIYNFEKAREILNRLLSKDDLHVRDLRITHDLNIQFYCRQAENLISQKNFLDAFKCYEKLQAACNNCPKDHFDHKMKSRIVKASNTIKSCINTIIRDVENEATKQRATNLMYWLNSMI